MRHAAWRLGLGWLLLAVLLCHATARAASVWITTNDGPAYTETAEALAANLRDQTVQTLPWRDLDAQRGPAPSIVVAVGSEALKQAVQTAEAWPRTAVIALLVPRSGLEQAARGGSGRVGGIYLDQSFARQMRLLSLVMPESKQVGILLGPSSKTYARELGQVAKKAGLAADIKVVESRDEVAPTLRAMLSEADALLAVPDGLLYGGQMLQYVLLASYRHGVPLIGYSAPLVKAGAIASLVSTPSQLGRQGAALVRRLLDGGRMPPPLAPDEYDVRVNASVARSLGFAVDEATLSARMRGGDEP